MNLPNNVISSCKKVMQEQWSDTATVTREVDSGHTTGTETVYDGIICHLSQTTQPVLDTSGVAAKTESVYTLLVDTSVTLKSGDALTVTHNGQIFEGIASEPFNRTFSNSVKVSVTKIS